MRRIVLSLASATALAACLGSPASAQATRTWVSGVGDDANPCSRTAPCKTFAGAISKTAGGGEIDVLDPGGFGAVTITKSITLDGAGTLASILTSAGSGVVVNAGVNDVVTIRNISFNGINGAAANGINFLAGAALIVEDSNIMGFNTAGINFVPSTGSARLNVIDTVLDNNTPLGAANAILVKPSGAANANATLYRVSMSYNKGGLRVDGTGGTGTTSVSLTDSNASNNTALGVTVVASPGIANLMIAHTTIANNFTAGVTVNGAGGTLWIGDSIVTANGIGLRQLAGTLNSYQNNQVNGNVGGNDTQGTISTVSLR